MKAMSLPIHFGPGKIVRYQRNTALRHAIKVVILLVAIILIAFAVYKLMPNPYLCNGYKPIKIGKRALEPTWTGEAYRFRFGIANSGILSVHDPILFLTFVEDVTVILHTETDEWKKNDDKNFFWAKKIAISGGVHIHDYAERALPIDVVFHKKGINHIRYVITSNGIQKTGEIKVINTH